jgi:hypothetical protein
MCAEKKKTDVAEIHARKSARGVCSNHLQNGGKHVILTLVKRIPMLFKGAFDGNSLLILVNSPRQKRKPEQSHTIEA